MAMNSDEEMQALIQSVLKGAKNRKAAREALDTLFPKVERERTLVSPDDQTSRERRANRQISNANSAPAYIFQLSRPPALWSKRELDELLSEPATAFEKADIRINQARQADRQKLQRTFLEALDGAFGPKRTFTSDWLQSIVDASPRYIRDDGKEGTSFIDNMSRLRFVVISGLETVTASERTKLFLEAVSRSQDLSLLSGVFRSIAGDLRPEGSHRDRFRSAAISQEDRVRDALLQRVKGLGETPHDFWAQARPGQLVWFWWGADNDSGALSDFIDRSMQEASALAALMEVMMGTVHSSSGSFETVSKESWARIVDIDRVASYARKLAEAQGEEANVASRSLSGGRSWSIWMSARQELLRRLHLAPSAFA